MNRIQVNIPKGEARDALISIEVDGDVLFTLTMKEEPDGSLYYTCFDEADLDGVFTIEGHLPDFFEEVTA